MKHVVNSNDLTLAEVDEILDLAGQIIENPDVYREVCKHKKLATLFFEASTRTRLSFEAAMLELGGSVIGFASATAASSAKGESVADTIRTVQCYADICAIRHPKEGAAHVAAANANIPIINAGDGGHQHPTQTLTDLLTIRTIKGRLSNLVVGVCGDLKFGRTVHSLVESLSQREGIEFVLISPEELKMPDYIIDENLIKNNIPFTETDNLKAAMPKLDILYMTRVQRERFFNEEEYIRLKDSYILDKPKLKHAKADMIIMHPLPRVNEIAAEVDDDPRAVYFKQVMYGKFARMALIMKLLEVEDAGMWL